MRTLIASRQSTCAVDKLTNGYNQGTGNDVSSCRDQNKEPVSEAEMGISENSSCLLNKRKFKSSGFTRDRGTTNNVVPIKVNPDNPEKGHFLLNQVENVKETIVPAFSRGQLKPLAENGMAAWKSTSRTGDKENETQTKGQGNMDGASGAMGATQSNTENKSAMMDNDVILLDDNMELPRPLINVRKETPLPTVVSQPGII